MAKFRKRSVVIDALQLRWDNWSEMCEFVPRPWFVKGVFIHGPESKPIDQPKSTNDLLGLIIKTMESNEFLAREGDWIIRGVGGEFYACKPDIFAATYEAV